jgi:hypothetical protein
MSVMNERKKQGQQQQGTGKLKNTQHGEQTTEKFSSFCTGFKTV